MSDLPPFVTPRPAKLTPVRPGSGFDGWEGTEHRTDRRSAQSAAANRASRASSEAEHEKDCERREKEDENGDTSENVVEIEDAQACFASRKVPLSCFSERVRLNNSIVQVWSKLF
jgi:hypothetical protein